MKKHIKKTLSKINPYIPGKPIEELKRELGLTDVIKLASNENPYNVSEKVLLAINEAALSVNRYPDGGCFYLREKLAKRLNVKANQLIFGNGSDEIIVMAVRALVKDGDEVVIADPSFLIYNIASLIEGAVVKKVPLVDFQYDLKSMKEAVSDKTRIIFLGNPDNPSGKYISQTQMEEFLQGLSKDVLVFIDEAYFEYVEAEDYVDSIKLIDQHSNVIVTRTFSKMYGLAGLRIGYGVASAEFVDELNRLREPFNVNLVAQRAAIAALDDEEHYQKIAHDVKAQRGYLYDQIRQLGLDYVSSYTNFILVDVKKDSSVVCQSLMEQGVIVRDMSIWGMKGFLRVSIGTSQENARFIESLKKALG